LFAEKADKINETRKDGERVQSEDRLFEATRWHLYRKAYADGTESITEDYAYALLSMENEMLTKPREHSAVKGKARRMSEYMQKKFVLLNKRYKDFSKEEKAKYMRNYRKQKRKTKNEKELEMTRRERALSNNAKRVAQTKASVKALMNNLISDEYKKKNGSWHIKRMAESLGMSARIISKYVKEIEEEQKNIPTITLD
jgi:type II secretory ATPase GspE/PulE/Tfp pilus assembly ATPase PilB-like protein